MAQEPAARKTKPGNWSAPGSAYALDELQKDTLDAFNISHCGLLRNNSLTLPALSRH